MKNISIIILFHNNRGIDICLQSVLGQLKGKDEIILIDDHSDVDCLNSISGILKTSNIRLYPATEKRGNRSYNRNLGARNSKNDVLLFLDGDMVLAKGSLNSFRRAHEKEGYVAFLGNAHGMRFSEIHMPLYLGYQNYDELLQSDTGRSQLLRDPALADWRVEPFRCKALEPYYWIYYYTCICSVSREVFQSIGGFDEALLTWGSEDIDLGYRLSLCGKIGHATGAHAFHVPHERNLWDEQLFDRDNTRYLLDKHRVWPFEFLLSFDLTGDIYRAIEELCEEISRWNIPYLRPKPFPDTIWINLPSAAHREDSVVWYDGAGKMTKTGLLGLSIPCCDKRFQTVYVSSNVFSYPTILTARIFQECMRIGNKTLLIPSGAAKRVSWNKDYLLQSCDIYRVYYVSVDTMEYELHPLEDGCFQVISPQIEQGLQRARSRCPILVSARARQKWHEEGCLASEWVLVNLLPRDTEDIRQKLECALGMRIVQAYRFPAGNSGTPLLDTIPYALWESRYPLFLVVSSSDEIGNRPAALRARNRIDLMLDIDGNLRSL